MTSGGDEASHFIHVSDDISCNFKRPVWQREEINCVGVVL